MHVFTGSLLCLLLAFRNLLTTSHINHFHLKTGCCWGDLCQAGWAASSWAMMGISCHVETLLWPSIQSALKPANGRSWERGGGGHRAGSAAAEIVQWKFHEEHATRTRSEFSPQTDAELQRANNSFTVQNPGPAESAQSGAQVPSEEEQGRCGWRGIRPK